MKKLLLFVLASITLTINGKLDSVTEDHYVVRTPQKLYYVKRESIRDEIKKKLKELEKPVSLTVPTSAIERITTTSRAR